MVAMSRLPENSSPCLRCSLPPTAVSSAPKSFSSGHGMKTQTRLPTLCASRSRHYANASANRGSSPLSPASATALTPNRTPSPGEETVDSSRGVSVRVKLALSYAGFLMLAGVVLLAAVWAFLLRYVPDRALLINAGTPIHGPFPIRSELLHVFAPRAAA